MKTPLLFLVFNRPEPTTRVFEAIRKIKPEKLFIAADGPRRDRPEDIEKCGQVRSIVKNIDWPCEVKTLFQEKTLGCQIAPSSAVTWFFKNVEAGIILEDDCLPDSSFFPFCEELLERYKNDARVWQISGDFFQRNYRRAEKENSYFFSSFPNLWGWASWRRAWKHYDPEMTGWPNNKDKGILRGLIANSIVYDYWENLWDRYYNGQRNSWDRPWVYILMLHKGLSINPTVNLISNLGFNSNATHTKDLGSMLSKMQTSSISFPLIHPKIIEQDIQADLLAFRYQFGIDFGLRKKVLSYLKRKFPNLYSKTKNLVNKKE